GETRDWVRGNLLGRAWVGASVSSALIIILNPASWANRRGRRLERPRRARSRESSVSARGLPACGPSITLLAPPPKHQFQAGAVWIRSRHPFAQQIEIRRKSF